MPNNIIRQDFGSLGNDVQTQMLIAPVLAEMIATQAFAINDQFIVDNVLYKATNAIAIGDAISVGTSASDNCVLSDSITQQIKSRGTLAKIIADGVKNYQQILNSLFAAVDNDIAQAHSNTLVLKVGNNILVCMVAISSELRFFNMQAYDQTNKFIATTASLKSQQSAYKNSNATTYTDVSTNIPTSGTVFEVLY